MKKSCKGSHAMLRLIRYAKEWQWNYQKLVFLRIVGSAKADATCRFSFVFTFHRGNEKVKLTNVLDKLSILSVNKSIKIKHIWILITNRCNDHNGRRTKRCQLEDIKSYLRIDGDEEDSLLRTMIDAGKEFIRSAVGEYDDTDSTAQVLLASVVQNMYDNRELMQSEQQVKKRIEYTFQSMILQLQMKYSLKQEEAES